MCWRRRTGGPSFALPQVHAYLVLLVPCIIRDIALLVHFPPSGLSGDDRAIYDGAEAVLAEIMADGMTDLEKGRSAFYSWTAAPPRSSAVASGTAL